MIAWKTKYNEDLEFIERFLKEKILPDPEILTGVFFDKLDRVGYSGVKIYIIEIKTTRNVPYQKFVFKVASNEKILRKKITEEKKNYDTLVKGNLQGAPEECIQYEKDKYIGIAYPHMDKQTFSSVYTTINLHNLFEQAFHLDNTEPDNTQKVFASVRDVIEKLYTQTMKPLMQGYEIKEDSWDSQYARYARMRKAEDRIGTILGCEDRHDHILYADRKFPNPIKVIKKILASRQPFLTRVVHGDLHQRNILLYEKIRNDHTPWLIDFEWVAKGKHYLIDYCLLECSIKFQYLTPLRTEQQIFSFEKALSREQINTSDTHSRVAFLYGRIAQIRVRAYQEYEKAMMDLGLPVSKDKWQREYSQVLILMTAGLIGIQSFEEIDKRGLVCSLLYHTNEFETSTRKLNTIGEHDIVSQYINKIWETKDSPQIIVDKGDDCSAFTLSDKDNVVVVSTDPCPIPVAWLLNELDYKVYGWYSMLINLSDLGAAGARPIGIHLSLEMSDDMPLEDFERFLEGVKELAEEYKCPIIGGNIKDSSRFICTGTIFGEMKRENIMLRTGAKVGDHVAVIGNMGLFWAAAYDYPKIMPFDGPTKRRLIKFPYPQIKNGQLIAERKLVTSCMDSSDGVISCLYEIAEKSQVQIEISHEAIMSRQDDRIKAVCEEYDIPPINLALTWGDWQLVVTVSDEKLEEFKELLGNDATIIGRVIEHGHPVTMVEKGKRYIIEDFGSKRFSDVSYFSNGLESYKKYLKRNFRKEL